MNETPQSMIIELIIQPEVEAFLEATQVDGDRLIDNLRRVSAHQLLTDRLPELSELCITLMTDQEIHELNLQYRKKDCPTDVLSFALLEGEEFVLPPGIPTPLGDIMISVETALKQSQRGALPRLSSGLNGETEWNLNEELSFLALHGFLHLLGYDHEVDEEAEEMEALELALLPTLLYERLYERHTKTES